jgi:uncharacterized protein YneF (UPF0154 family)
MPFPLKAPELISFALNPYLAGDMSYSRVTADISGNDNTTLAGNIFSNALNLKAVGSRKKTTKKTVLLFLAVLFVLIVVVGIVLGVFFAVRKDQDSTIPPPDLSDSGVEVLFLS